MKTMPNNDADELVFAAADAAAGSLVNIGEYSATLSGGLTSSAKWALNGIAVKISGIDILQETLGAPNGMKPEAFAVAMTAGGLALGAGVFLGAPLLTATAVGAFLGYTAEVGGKAIMGLPPSPTA